MSVYRYIHYIILLLHHHHYGHTLLLHHHHYGHTTQEEYYATHQCFLTARSLFLLVWNVTDGEAGLLSLQPWLENIEVHMNVH